MVYEVMSHRRWSVMCVVMIVTDVVAAEIALVVVDQRLEVEIRQLIHHVEHDILQEFIIELGSTGQDLQVATVLWQATIHNCIVLVVCVHDGVLEPLVVSVSDEALAVGQLVGAVHLAVAAEMGSEGLLLADRVLHKAAAIVHCAVDSLPAHPLVGGKGSLINVHNLIPSAHEMCLFEFFGQGLDDVANDVLLADRTVVDRLKGLRDGHNRL